MSKYFTLDEFACKETGENLIDLEFVHRLDELREWCDFPFVITSGYRSPIHSIEAKKDKPGRHTEGIAADIRVADGVQRRVLVDGAMHFDFGGIGVAKTFVHIDLREGQRVCWCY